MRIYKKVIVSELTAEDVTNILSCESGGFDYWAETCPKEKQYETAKQELLEAGMSDVDICYEDVLAQIVLHHDGLIIFDWEEDKDHLLTYYKLQRGIEAHIEQSGHDDPDEWDAMDADCILQFALFGELVYG